MDEHGGTGAATDDEVVAAPVVPLTVLAVGTDDWAVDQAAGALEAAGHRVRRCHEPGEAPFPCNAFIPGRGCPLDDVVDVVATIRARLLPHPSPGEVGVVCSLRRSVPLVVGGMASNNPFGAWAARTVDRQGDVVSACEDAAASSVIDLTAERTAPTG